MSKYPDITNETELLKIKKRDDEVKNLKYQTEKHDYRKHDYEIYNETYKNR